MATEEQESQSRNELKTRLAELSAIDARDLARADALGSEFTFQPAVPYLQRIQNLFAKLARANLDDIAYTVLQTLNGLVSNALALFNEVRAFSPSSQANPTQVRGALIEKARDQYDSYYRTLAPWIAYLSASGTDLESLERKALEFVQRIELEGEQAKESASRRAHEVEQILEKVKNAAAEVGVAQHSKHFHEEAEEHRRASRKWFFSVAGLSVFGAVFSIWYFQHNIRSLHSSPYWWTHVGYFGSRLLVLSVIFFGIAWSASNFRSHKHNEVINRHRQNALRTFETFVKATEETETKDAVLLAATKSIFEGQSGGYVSGEGDQVPSNTVIEVLRRVASERGGH